MINANGMVLTVSMCMSVIDKSGTGIAEIKWKTTPALRAAMVYAALLCRKPQDHPHDIETETVKMLESGEWKDNFRFLGVRVVIDESIPMGTVRLDGESGVCGEIINAAIPIFYQKDL